MPRVVIAAGGTAGHVVPAMAVAEELRARGAGVSFVGTRERIEAELVPAGGFEIDFIDVRGIDRRNPLRAAAASLRAIAAVGAARTLLRRREPSVVMGGGGFVAGPVGLAAASQRRPLVLTEADSHLGLANRLLAGRAERVCLAFPIEGREGPRYEVTGRPVSEAILNADREAARRRFGIGAEEPCVLVMGGSQGARSINLAAIEAFGSSGPRVIHVAGRRDYEQLRAALPPAAQERYALLAYEADLGDCLAACDLVLGRAGGSIFEVTAAGRPAILVPYPHATADHQTANARWMAQGGAAVVLADADLTPLLLRSQAGAILGDRARLERMAEASRRLARPRAAQTIAGIVLAAAAERHAEGRG